MKKIVIGEKGSIIGYVNSTEKKGTKRFFILRNETTTIGTIGTGIMGTKNEEWEYALEIGKLK